MLTVVGRDQLVHAVVWLAAVDYLLAVVRPLWELVRPVHPVDSRVNVVFVAGADLQDAGDPVVVGLRHRVHRLIAGFLALDAGVVCDVDEAFAKVFYSVDCATERTSLLVRSSPGRARRME